MNKEHFEELKKSVVKCGMLSNIDINSWKNAKAFYCDLCIEAIQCSVEDVPLLIGSFIPLNKEIWWTGCVDQYDKVLDWRMRNRI